MTFRINLVTVSWNGQGLMGYPRKNPNEGLRMYFFERDPWNFKICHCTLGNSRENEASPREIPQNCVTLNRISKTRNQEAWMFHMIFSWSSLEILLHFLLNPGICTSFFYNTPGNFMFSIPRVWIFSEIAQYSSENLQCSDYLKMHLSFRKLLSHLGMIWSLVHPFRTTFP